MDKIKVLIIDDHTLFREGLKALLNRQESIEVVGEAGTGREGIEKAVSLRPDVILLDIKMPDIGGLETLRRIMDRKPDARVLMLTISENDEDLFDAVRAGARGYLLKNIETDRLVYSIHQVLRGEAAVSGSLTERIFAEFRSMSSRRYDKQSIREVLSNREREILIHITNGESNKEIANNLNIAESTVKIHVQNILKKLNVTSRVQAAVYAIEQGLARDSEDL